MITSKKPKTQMKQVICIYNYPSSGEKLPLTINKKYKVLEEKYITFSTSSPDRNRGPFYLIIDDNNFQRWSLTPNFRDMTIEEIREDKLNSLLT